MDNNFLRYNALDAACTLDIHNKMWGDLSEGYQTTYDMTLALFPVLMFMQTRGVRVSLDLLDETKADVVRAIADKQEELDEEVGFSLNVNSSKQCKQYFYITLDIPPYLNKQKKPTVDDATLQKLVRGTAKRKGLRSAKLIQEIRGLQKLYSTYLNMEFDKDGRMRGSYNPRGTKFGRLSSSKTIFGTGMNFQNLPQAFKKFLTPDPGYVFIEPDKRQAEWVVVAYCADDPNMISAIEQGVDVHVHTASLMFGVEPELIEYDSKIIGHSTDADWIAEARAKDSILAKYGGEFPRNMSARQCGKKSNHGLNYDEGPNGFATINEMPIGEGKRIHKLYHSIYPGISLWYEHVKRQLQKDRTLTNCFGRKVRFMSSWCDDMWKSAYSMLPQSTVVDGLNQGMVKVYNDRTLTHDYNLDILAQVHDSILMQVPIENLRHEGSYNEIMGKIRDYTTPTMKYNGREFTIATDFKVGLNWGSGGSDNPTGMVDVESFSDMQAHLNNWEGHAGTQ